MNMRPGLLYAALVFGLVCSGAAIAVSKPNPKDSIEKYQYKSALKASQDAIGGIISDHPLTNSAGEALSVGNFRGKPLVLSLIYTSCYAICPITTQHLAKVVEKARDALGTGSFSVAVLGFDARFDSPQAMQQFARKQGVDDAQWHVLSAGENTINALTEQLGFKYFSSPNGFDHIVQASIIDADGRVYRQVYGETFETPLLISPLMDLVLGRAKPNQSLLDDLIDKVRFFCTTYDPASDAYSFDYSLFIGMIIGGVIIVLIIAFILREYRYGRRHPQA
jgi:protein SCO1/2